MTSVQFHGLWTLRPEDGVEALGQVLVAVIGPSDLRLLAVGRERDLLAAGLAAIRVEGLQISTTLRELFSPQPLSVASTTRLGDAVVAARLALSLADTVEWWVHDRNVDVAWGAEAYRDSLEAAGARFVEGNALMGSLLARSDQRIDYGALAARLGLHVVPA